MKASLLVAMQRAEQQLMELPDAIWSKVLSHLCFEDLLDARLVRKEFVQLSQLPELAMDWEACNPGASSSLMLFAFQHLMQRSSPPLSISLPCLIAPSQRSYLQLTISLACQCNSLRHLDISERLTLAEMQGLLQMLPMGLSSLELFVTGDLSVSIEDTAWGRLAALTCLQLWLPRGLQSIIVQGSLLAHLPSLNSSTLMFDESDGGDEETGMINTCVFNAETLVHQGITKLECGDDPIRGHLNLARLPCLRTIQLSEHCMAPTWLQGQHWGSQLDLVDLHWLFCRPSPYFPTLAACQPPAHAKAV